MGDEVRVYRNEVIRIVDLAVTANRVRLCDFKDCRIIGPAVVVPAGSTQFHACQWRGDPDALLWEVPETRSSVIGAIGLEDCLLEDCVMECIGVAGPPELIDRFRADLSGENGDQR